MSSSVAGTGTNNPRHVSPPPGSAEFTQCGKETDMAVRTVQDLFVDELRDIYSAEKQLTRALPKMAKAATDLELNLFQVKARSLRRCCRQMARHLVSCVHEPCTVIDGPGSRSQHAWKPRVDVASPRGKYRTSRHPSCLRQSGSAGHRHRIGIFWL